MLLLAQVLHIIDTNLNTNPAPRFEETLIIHMLLLEI